MVGATKPGTRVTVTVWRKGAARDFTVVLAELDADKPAKKGEKKQKEKAEQSSNTLGLTTSDLSDEQKKRIESRAWRAWSKMPKARRNGPEFAPAT